MLNYQRVKPGVGSRAGDWDGFLKQHVVYVVLPPMIDDDVESLP